MNSTGPDVQIQGSLQEILQLSQNLMDLQLQREALSVEIKEARLKSEQLQKEAQSSVEQLQGLRQRLHHVKQVEANQVQKLQAMVIKKATGVSSGVEQKSDSIHSGS